MGKNEFKVSKYFLIMIALNFIMLCNLKIASDVKVTVTEHTGVVLEVYPLPGETCDQGELKVIVQAEDTIICLYDEKDWFTLYDKVGKEITLTKSIYHYKSGDVTRWHLD